jgi:hypothetical protein
MESRLSSGARTGATDVCRPRRAGEGRLAYNFAGKKPPQAPARAGEGLDLPRDITLLA